MFEDYSGHFKTWLVRNKGLFLFSLCIAVLCYGYEIFNFSLSIDEEIASFSDASGRKTYLLIGRWGTYLLNHLLFSQSIIPYAPFLFGVLCLALSGVLLASNLPGSTASKILFLTIFITAPFHSYYLAFNTADPFFGIGMIFTVISYHEAVNGLTSGKKISFLVSSLLLAFALSIYQALFSFFVTLVVFHLLLMLRDNENCPLRSLFKNAGLFTLLAVFALGIYKAGDLLARWIFIDYSNISGAAYLEAYKGWGKAPVGEILNNLNHSTLNFFTGKMIPAGSYITFLSVIFLVPLLLWQLSKGKTKLLNKVIRMGLMVLLLFAPFTLMYLNGAPFQVRSMLAFPLMLAMLWWLPFDHLGNYWKKMMLGLGLVVFINNMTTTTRLFYSSTMTWQADRELANRLLERIHALELPQTDEKIPVVFFGAYSHPANRLFIHSDIFGASFFGWDDCNPSRVTGFLRTLGIEEIQVIPETKVNKRVHDSVQHLPVWPRKGSVCLIDSIVVVKLSRIQP